MAHRIYLYNLDSKSKETFPNYLGEWNYEIPLLLVPLVSGNLRAKGKQLFADKQEGISRLRSFFNLIADTYQWHYKKFYYEPVNQMFQFLEDLPFDTFQIDGSDVFTMNEESPKEQAKDWVLEIDNKWKNFETAIEHQDLNFLNPQFFMTGYQSFQEIMETDWINYGLGYFEYDLFLKNNVNVYEVDGKFGLETSKGVKIIDPIYDEIYDWSDTNIALVRKDGLFGYIAMDGKVLVPTIYEDAYDVNSFDKMSVAEVHMNGKIGVINCNTNQQILPCEYDELEILNYAYFNVSKNGIWQVFGIENQQLLNVSGSNIFDIDYCSDLFFTKEKGTQKRKFYTKKGFFVGEYVEESISKIGENYYQIKPNKFQTKFSIINFKGEILETEIDKVILLDDYQSFAFKKDKKWRLFDGVKHVYVLENEEIEDVFLDDFKYIIKNTWGIKTSSGKGLYHALEHQFWIELNSDYKAFEVLNAKFLRIKSQNYNQFFDVEKRFLSDKYDFVCTPFFSLNGDSDLGENFVLINDNQVFRVLENQDMQLISEEKYGEINEQRYNLRGEDLNFWNQFFEIWSKNSGEDYELKFDLHTIFKLAINYAKNGQFDDAIRLYTHTSKLGDIDSMIELGLLLSDKDADYYRPKEAVMWTEKAAETNNAVAFNNLGYFYQNEIGYDFNVSKMFEMYEKAAALGEGMAMSNLGDLYFYAEHVDQDYDKALEYYKEASKKLYSNNAKVVEIYYQKEDFENLLKHLKKDYEDSYSNIYYGILYDFGYGVKQHSKKAVKYYEKANNYDFYPYATERLLSYYSEDGELANPRLYEKWRQYAEDNDIDI
ncbi:tetratricopeptide repeat protein [Soonwooa sp.]|uniref:tetratricopeptide repeat protein n=1 Tax=Soonwooa sp. TaxID=1938592 RepID=UPI0035B43B31